jgi:hypothetical protein
MKLRHAAPLTLVGWYVMVALFLNFIWLRTERIGTAWASESSKRVKVFVTCSGEDSIGTRLCSQLKEKIRGSKGFELVQSAGTLVFCVHIVSTDIGSERGNYSAASRTFTLGTAQGTELYLTAGVESCGVSRVADCVDDLFADIDKDSEFLRK